MAKIELLQKRDIGRLITDTFGFIKQEGMSLYKKLLIIGLPLILLISVIETAAWQNDLSLFAGNIFNLILIVIFDAYVITYMKHYYENYGETDQSKVWSEAKSSIGAILIKTLVIGVLTGLGLLALIIPGIYLMVALSLVIPLTIFEDEYSSGYKRSIDLIKGNFFFALGGWFVIFVLTYVFYMVFSLPFIIVDFTNISPVLLFVLTLISNIGTLFVVIPIVFSVLLYHHLLMIKEEPELMNRIDKLGTDTETA